MGARDRCRGARRTTTWSRHGNASRGTSPRAAAAALTASLLRRAGHDVATADDGDAALAILGAEPGRDFDLVLLDMMMPGTDGFGVLAALRSDPRMPRVPVVMYSAEHGNPARARAAALGADGFLVKGRATHDDLLAAVDFHAARCSLGAVAA